MTRSKSWFCKVLLPLFAVVFLVTVINPENAVAGFFGNTKDNAGWITELNGTKGYIDRSTGEKTNATVGKAVFTGDIITTGENTSLTIQLEDDTVVTVDENSKIEITEYLLDSEYKANRSVIGLFSGRLRAVLNDYFGTKKSSFTVMTDSAVAGVKGSDISVWIKDGVVSAAVSEGEGFIEERSSFEKGGNIENRQRRELSAGYMASLSKGKKLGLKKKISKKVKKKIQKLKVEKKKELIEKLRKKKLERKNILKNKLENKKKIKKKKSLGKNKKNKKKKGKGKFEEEEN